MIEEHHRGGKVSAIDRGVRVRAATQKYITDQRRLFPVLAPVKTSDIVRRTHERLNLDLNSRDHEIIAPRHARRDRRPRRATLPAAEFVAGTRTAPICVPWAMKAAGWPATLATYRRSNRRRAPRELAPAGHPRRAHFSPRHSAAGAARPPMRTSNAASRRARRC